MDLSRKISYELPFLRRYARALTGSQENGDEFAVATLEAILKDRSLFEDGLDVRVGLFKTFHAIWLSSRETAHVQATGLESKAQEHLASLTVNSREVLLLKTIEGFTVQEITEITGFDQNEVEALNRTALQEMENSIRGKVMIIEDETVIAADLSMIISDLGHSVTGVARTRTKAVTMGLETRPDLILADIHLADNSSGIDAINDLMKDMEEVPVIFITAYPERLLTGDKLEPAFLISKPYSEEQVASAVSQAMFFSSVETLVS